MTAALLPLILAPALGCLSPEQEEAAVVSFEFPSSRISEDAGHAELTVILSGPSRSAVVVEVQIVSGSATRDTDFRLGTTPLQVPPGETRVLLDVEIVCDLEREEDETIEFALAPGPGAVAGANAKHLVVIEDENDFVDFEHSELEIHLSFVYYSADFEAGPEFGLGALWRVPLPGILERLGAFAWLEWTRMEREIERLPSPDGSVVLLGAGLDYALLRDDSWFALVQAGIGYGWFEDISETDDGFGVQLGLLIGYRISDAWAVTVDPNVFAAVLDFDGDEFDWTFFGNVGILYRF